MKARLGAAATLIALAAVPAFGSGGPPPAPLYVDHHGGSEAELRRLHRGRTGLVMARSHSAHLYLQWRLLHGLEVGDEAGEALAPLPVDDEAPTPFRPSGSWAWLDARSLVPGLAETRPWVAMDLPGPDYSRIENCFGDAFETAAATLRARLASHGRESPAIRSWVGTQEAVFDACSNPAAALPPAASDAPAWLKADRAYQEAAFALYTRNNIEAANRFAAIVRDRASPWQPMALYLGARALQRQAMKIPSPDAFTAVRSVLARLEASPPGTYGRAEARNMRRALDFRERPRSLLAELDHALTQSRPADEQVFALRDYLSLARRAAVRPEAADWLLNIEAADGAEALAHARARWAATRDPAWLVAALTHAGPGDEAAAALAADAERVDPGHPAWLSARYHLVRLTIATADPALTRARIDAVLARGDVTLSERYIFTAARAQAASDARDFVRHALRRPYCITFESGTCSGEDWYDAQAMLAQTGDGRWVGLGADAKAIIDRLPIAERIALSRDPALPASIRLDVTLTGFARAVLLQDDAAIDRLAGDLAILLPQMRQDMQAIPAARAGPARRFAQYFAMAKIPGLRTDLIDYTRPVGTIRQFEGRWVNWMVLPRARPAGEPATLPNPISYRWDGWYGPEGEEQDLTCLGQCGPAGFPFHPPRFVAALEGRARAERAAFDPDPPTIEPAPRSFPAGTVAVWEEVLAFARANPRDPRSPEALYWLIRIARWGGSHNHSGCRAFRLLHRRYPGSDWARRSPYCYD